MDSNKQPPNVPFLEAGDLARAPDYLKMLESLVEHPGWQLISRILEEQAAMRTNGLISTPLASLDGALEQEYKKGEAIQLLTLRGLPEVLIEELKVVVANMREEADATGSDDTTE